MEESENKPHINRVPLNAGLCVRDEDVVPDGYFEKLTIAISLLSPLPDEDISDDPPPLV